MRKRSVAAAGVVAFVVGVIVGGAAKSPDPEVRILTETVTETVVEVPDSCLVALRRADEGFAISGEVMGASGEAFGAASEAIRAIVAGDYATAESKIEEMNDAGDRMNAAADRLDADAYVAAKTACRAGGE